jgi:hypothetical protein
MQKRASRMPSPVTRHRGPRRGLSPWPSGRSMSLLTGWP